MSGKAAQADRAERLGVLLYLCRGSHGDPTQFWDELLYDEQAALADLTEDDMHLANACIEAEARALRHEFEAVERLLARGMFGEQEADAKFDAAVERSEIGRIAQDLIDLMDLGLY